MESIAKNAGALGAVFAKDEQTAEPAPMTIEAAVRRNLERYFDNLQGAQPHALYPMVLSAMEKPLLEFAMQRTRHNKCAAAQLLGINRNTLHKKLRMYNLD